MCCKIDPSSDPFYGPGLWSEIGLMTTQWTIYRRSRLDNQGSFSKKPLEWLTFWGFNSCPFRQSWFPRYRFGSPAMIPEVSLSPLFIQRIDFSYMMCLLTAFQVFESRINMSFLCFYDCADRIGWMITLQQLSNPNHLRWSTGRGTERVSEGIRGWEI